MELNLSTNRTMGEVQADFNAQFPYLKLAFFNKSHKAYQGSNAKFLLQNKSATLRELCEKPHEGLLYLSEDMPTWQVERLFEEDFGLHVQVFRKSGNVWLETSRSDDLTLEQQNAKGRASEHMAVPIADALDYREMD